MSNLKLKPLVLVIVSLLAVGQIVIASADDTKTATANQSKLREEVVTNPGRSITPSDEQLLSSSANKVLNHLAKAKEALENNKKEPAQQELSKADTLLDIIYKVAPTKVVKDRIWTADNKLSYENTEEVVPDSIPIYARLGEQELFSPTKTKSSNTEKNPSSKTNAKSTQKSDTNIALIAQDDMFYYEELDLPLSATRHFINIARAEIDKNQLTKAQQTLRTALGSVEVVGVFLPQPMVAARNNLEQAHSHYSAGQISQAKVDLSAAIEQLTAAVNDGNQDVQKDVQKLLKDATTLQGRMDKSESVQANEFKRLWRHTEALAERAIESTSVGWERLREHNAVRANLIEAKRFVAYADIDVNIAQDQSQAMIDLGKAQDYLQKAAKEMTSNNDALVYVKDAKSKVDNLIAGQSKADKKEMTNLKTQISQAINRV
jgi:hypothetical protein